MKSYKKLITILLILLFLSVFYPIREAPAIPETNQRLIPFIGMVVDYRLNVRIKDIPVIVTVNWTVTWEQYNITTPSIFISNLTVKSMYITLFSGVDRESGFIIENITSRQVLFVNLNETTFLYDVLYDLYYSLDRPTYSPFYINTTGISINDQINVYSFNMTVVNTDRVSVADYGWRDVWIIQTNATEENVEHFISLVFDNRTGVLVGGRIHTRWFIGSQQEYDVTIICQYTNALERHLIIIKTNRILVVLVSCLPILPSLVKFSRMKEIKGGL